MLSKPLEFFVLFALLSSIFLPPINFMGLTLYLTTILSPLIFFIYIISVRMEVNKFLFLILLICFSVVISSLYSSAIGITSFSIRNYIEVVKYFQFIPYVLIIYFFYRLESSVFEEVLNIISVFFIFIFLTQWLDVFGLKRYIVNLYLDSNSNHYDKALESWRVTLTGAGPNEGGAIAVFLYIYNLLKLVDGKNLFYGCNILFLTLSILMTQSRTALLGAIFITFLLIFYVKKVSYIYKFFLLIFLSLVGFFLFYSLELDYIKIGFDLTMSGDNESLNIRTDRLNDALFYFSQSPIFGVGPAKNELSTIIDSEYVLILQRYGIFGIFSFSLFIFSLFLYGLKNKENISGLLLMFYTIFTLIIMFTNNAYSGYQLMAISIFLILWNYSSISRNQAGV